MLRLKILQNQFLYLLLIFWLWILHVTSLEAYFKIKNKTTTTTTSQPHSSRWSTQISQCSLKHCWTADGSSHLEVKMKNDFFSLQTHRMEILTQSSASWHPGSLGSLCLHDCMWHEAYHGGTTARVGRACSAPTEGRRLWMTKCDQCVGVRAFLRCVSHPPANDPTYSRGCGSCLSWTLNYRWSSWFTEKVLSHAQSPAELPLPSFPPSLQTWQWRKRSPPAFSSD